MRFRLLICLWGLLLLGSFGAQGQTAEENLFYNAAVLAFQDATYERAENQFAEFVRKFPASTRLSEAILFQACAALKQRKFEQGTKLLTSNLERAGILTDQYRYWLAESHLETTNYQAAAEAFSQFAREFTNSVRLLEASYGEAQARFKLCQFGRVAELLNNPDGIFQREGRARQHDELVVRGLLMLAESWLEQKAYANAGAVLSRLEDVTLPELKWQRQYDLIRAKIGTGELEPAASDVTNLLALAGLAGQATYQAKSIALQGRIAEQMTNFDLAIQAYTNNLAPSTPADYRRSALLKVVQLNLAQNRLAEAAGQLQLFYAATPDDPNSDLALLTLGEVFLKQHQQMLQTNQSTMMVPGAGLTNGFILQAAACFDRLLTNFPQTALFGQAQLGLGWCYSEQRKIPESLLAFKLAAERLPRGESQAVARLKLADNFFLQKDYTNALNNYRLVINDYSDLPKVQSDLVEQCLYQSLRASLELRDVPAANAAMRKILNFYPRGVYGERSQLLVGQNLLDLHRPSEARAIFNQFIARCPASPLLPEVKFAVARSYILEMNWDAAAQTYEAWLTQFPANALTAQAEFNRAWVQYLAGRETNALGLFTNYVVLFPTNELAPFAQNWVADYFFRQGNYTNAELNYQQLFQNTNWPPTPLAHEARMMAGRAAFARQAYKNAEEYFQSIINDNSATNHWPEAFYALGDTILLAETEATNQVRKFEWAKDAFWKIPQLFPAHPLVGYAWGRIGDCYFQAGAQDLKSYDAAIDAYQHVLAPSNHADLTARCQAEFGWAKVLERQARIPAKTPPEKLELQKTAQAHYLNIFDGKILAEDEEMDPFWMKEAGFAAATLAEELKEWETAVNLYRRLQDSFPIYRATLEKRADKARESMRAEKL